MDLVLAIVSACSETGCSVTPLDDSSPLEVNYSKPVRDRIRILPGHLVAINTAKDPPEIVWRWIRGVVVELSPGVIVVDDLQGHPARVQTVDELSLDLSIDDEVWACGTGSGFEIHDRLLDGQPAQPERLLRYITPVIEAMHHRLKG